ncbi:substrate-binding periplasmic protein [Spartinivicinus poritis]|uniref:Solute-binding protein family 3/N-terminal domain-containing protein n=1 Tax=Spartinivicinus poritis TaxID=2994640 RepID=A0ABT5U2U0_9GAMM|nr:hypothetical protein [Spartinivicinus sp. A2-2]MDE1460684.1 hypothetical protein [Spartinivicinus sp. A2-2]
MYDQYFFSYYLVSVLSLTGLSWCASAQLTIATLADKDLTHVRVMEKILTDAYGLLDIPIELKIMPNKRSLLASNSGRVDGEAGRIAGMEKEYPNLVMVPEFLYSLNVLVYSKKHHFTVAGWESLRPYRIGVLRGAKYAEIGSKGMDTLIVSYGTQLFQALDAGRIDVAVLHESGNLSLSGVKGVNVLQPPLQKIIIYHYLHKKHQSLVPMINCAIRKVKNKKLLAYCTKLLGTGV